MNKTVLWMILTVVALDRITKHLVERYIPVDGGFEVIPRFLRLTHLQNSGSAFSFFAQSSSRWRAPALIVFSAAALVIMLVMLWRDRRTSMITIALGLIFAGALGNLWDRLSKGSVTDFLDFYAGAHHWYPFNIADSAIVVGALVLASRMLRHSETQPQAEPTS